MGDSLRRVKGTRYSQPTDTCPNCKLDSVWRLWKNSMFVVRGGDEGKDGLLLK